MCGTFPHTPSPPHFAHLIRHIWREWTDLQDALGRSVRVKDHSENLVYHLSNQMAVSQY